ncbi:serine hydrolase domain-containing protein [Pseudoneobacillus sp. C159]
MKLKVLYIGLILGLLNGCTNTTMEKVELKEPEEVVEHGKIPEKLPAYWPTTEWKTSLPEQQGMSSSKLADLFEKIVDASPLDGLIIIRNGYIVAEKYDEDLFGVDETHPINSVTKSFMSAVTGVAIQEGYIESVDDRILDYFPNRKIANVDENKKNWTIKDFLTMNGGLDWPELDQERKHQFWREFESTDDTVQYSLDQPTDPNLVDKFHYNSGLPHILSAIIQQKTGMKTSEYAKAKIFDRIGITTAYWPEAQGVSKGGYRMEMTPRDMARFGYLYMNKGKWDGEQIIPEDWVETSMSPLIPTDTPGGEHYGYYFWITTTQDGYKEISAMGDRGQYIIMVPELDLLVIQTSSDWFTDIDIYQDYIYSAVESSQPIPVDKEGNSRLNAIKSL